MRRQVKLTASRMTLAGGGTLTSFRPFDEQEPSVPCVVMTPFDNVNYIKLLACLFSLGLHWVRSHSAASRKGLAQRTQFFDVGDLMGVDVGIARNLVAARKQGP